MGVSFFARALSFAAFLVAFVGCRAAPDEIDEIDEGSAASEATTCAAPRPGHNTGFSAGGQQRSFELLLPPSSFGGPRPILFAYHGTSENGAKFIARAKLADFAARGFVVVAPDAAGNGDVWPIWDAMRLPGHESAPNPDLALFDGLLGCVGAHYAIDLERVYATGHSAGGIFTNRLLRSRSHVLAGAIVASGVFDLTGDGERLEPTFALVTWGGDNDQYSGTTPSGVHVPAFSFVEQASLASKFYAAEDGVVQAHCRGDNLGHAWLPLNAWFADVLLARPKGSPGGALAPLPSGSPASCSSDVFMLPPLPELSCPATSRAGCTATCQLIADCAVENRTVGPSLANELRAIGFTGTSCGGCVQRCQLGATSAGDARVLACFAARQAHASCGPGLEGAEPLLDAVNACCENGSDSTLCTQVCSAISQDSVASAFFPTCRALTRQ